MVFVRENFPKLTPAEYLEWEEKQEFKYEYVDGKIYAITGGTLNHSEIAANFITLLKAQLRGGGCRVLNSDAKVQIAASNDYVYPDISVTCDERDKTASKFVSHPCMIVEVLSPSTEAYDRGKKFRLYRRLVRLKEYVLVSTTEICLDVYQRNEKGQWLITSYGEGDVVEIKSVNFSFPIKQIYENIVFAPEE